MIAKAKTKRAKVPARDPSPGVIQSLERGLRILDLVVNSTQPLRLRDIAGALSIDRAIAYRFLQTLVRSGVLRKEDSTKSYVPGSRLFSWMLLAGRQLHVVDAIRPFLREVVEQTQHSAHLGVLVHEQVLLADFVPSDSLVSVKNRIGVLEPLYCTAIGKAVLTLLPDESQVSHRWPGARSAHPANHYHPEGAATPPRRSPQEWSRAR